jgi:hypothetical protein
MDVHARSTHAAVVSAVWGELWRARFGGEVEPVVEWLVELPGPVHAVYEAGPTGYRLARAAAGRGVRVDVIAPGKTPRAAADRIKTDRRDAELLVRLLMAGSLQTGLVIGPLWRDSPDWDRDGTSPTQAASWSARLKRCQSAIHVDHHPAPIPPATPPAHRRHHPWHLDKPTYISV